jgi:hypothetical protein
LRGAVREVVARQAELGIDIINDGEYGKAMRSRLDYGAWISYVIERFTGFEDQGAKGAESAWGARGANGAWGAEGLSAVASAEADAIKPGSHKNRRDRQAFPEVYADVDREMFAGGPSLARSPTAATPRCRRTSTTCGPHFFRLKAEATQMETPSPPSGGRMPS